MKKKIHAGFTMIDEEVMKILSDVLKIKIYQLLAVKRQIDLESDVLHTLRIAGILTTQRSQADLVKYCKIIIPPYFGFEAAGILLRDVKSN